VHFAKSASTCLKYDFDQPRTGRAGVGTRDLQETICRTFRGGVTKLSTPGGMINRPVTRTALSLGMRLWAIP
jgi:hypothetical protein